MDAGAAGAAGAEGAAGAAGALGAAGAAYHSFTPPWPLQAPLFGVADVVLPSLQVPVAAAAAGAAVATLAAGIFALAAFAGFSGFAVAAESDCADSFSFVLLELFAEDLPSSAAPLPLVAPYHFFTPP